MYQSNIAKMIQVHNQIDTNIWNDQLRSINADIIEILRWLNNIPNFLQFNEKAKYKESYQTEIKRLIHLKKIDCAQISMKLILPEELSADRTFHRCYAIYYTNTPMLWHKKHLVDVFLLKKWKTYIYIYIYHVQF